MHRECPKLTRLKFTGKFTGNPCEAHKGTKKNIYLLFLVLYFM